MSDTAIAARPEQGIVQSADVVKLLRDTYATGLNDTEFQLYQEIIRRTGLDPFQKQIYAIKRKVWNKETRQKEDRVTFQTGIDGYRALAERTGQYAGGPRPELGPPCGCEIAKKSPHPEWAAVTVNRRRDDAVDGTEEVAYFHEYAPTFEKDGHQALSGLWQQMPRGQIIKCAEAKALRRAFPTIYHGVYIDDELPTQTEPAEEARTVTPPRISEATPSPAQKSVLPPWRQTDWGIAGLPDPTYKAAVTPRDEDIIALPADLRTRALKDLATMLGTDADQYFQALGVKRTEKSIQALDEGQLVFLIGNLWITEHAKHNKVIDVAPEAVTPEAEKLHDELVGPTDTEGDDNHE